MNSKHSFEYFKRQVSYFGVLLTDASPVDNREYYDIESFILNASLYARSSRQIEGFLCWVKKYVYIISPSKLRKLINDSHPYNSSFLGAILDFAQKECKKPVNFKILKPFLTKERTPYSPIEGPRVRSPLPSFEKRGILVPNFELNGSKFLLNHDLLLAKCPEMRFRLLFGQVVNADLAAALSKDPTLNAYRATLLTNNHKARVFSVFNDVQKSLNLVSNGV